MYIQYYYSFNPQNKSKILRGLSDHDCMVFYLTYTYGVRVRVMVFKQYFSYIVAISVVGAETVQKTTNLPQVTDKTLSHNVVSSTLCLSGIRTHNKPMC